MLIPDAPLATPPKDPRALELWLQHAVGYMFMANARQHALGCMDPNLIPEARAAAEEAINDTLYGVMMMLDKVSSSLGNGEYEVDLRTCVRLLKRTRDDEFAVQAEVDLCEEGQGMCMAFHGWVEGDFGERRIVKSLKPRRKR